MIRLALRSTLAKKRRLLGTALSVLLGVAFLSGTLVFTDSIRRTFDDLFAGAFADTDVYVRPEASIEVQGGGEQRGRMPESIVDTVRAVPGVAGADGVISGFAQIVDAEGDAIGNPARGAPTFGMSYSTITPWELTDGSKPPGPGEVVVDHGSAEAGDLEIGDAVTIVTQSGPHELDLVGTARFGSVDSPGGASVSVLELETAQALLGDGQQEGDAVLVDADPRLSEEDLTTRVAAALPSGVEAVTGSTIVKENQDAMREGLGFVNTFLLVFAVIALVVAGFTIYNTFQIIVTQRTREMALLRSIGATRRQVLSAQLLEALITGVTASVLGIAAGFGVASLLRHMMETLGIDLPPGGAVFQTRTAVAGLVVGTVVTVASAVLPSVRAARVPPLAALRSAAALVADRAPGRRAGAGGSLVTLGAGGIALGLNGSGALWVGVGAFLCFVGTFALGPLLARPAARALGAPLAGWSVTGLIARENAARDPKRTARTGGALMGGVALVTAVTIIAATAKDWTRDVFEDPFRGAYVVSSDSIAFGGLSPTVAADLNALPEVATATGLRVGSAVDVSGGGDSVTYVAIDPVTASGVFDLGMIDGAIDDLTAEGILVADDLAEGRALEVGDSTQMQFLDGTVRSLVVQGLYADDDLAGPFVVSQDLHAATGADQFDFAVFVTLAPGVSPTAAEHALASVSDRFPNADLESRDEYVETQAAQVDQILNLMYGLLGLAVLIALFSIANSVSLSIHERTHELGLLRAVGMTRHQAGSAIRWEAGMVATLGTTLGVVLGVCFGWAISVALRNDGLTAVVLPGVPLVVIAGVAVIGGVLAALRPGWRAAHLDVLRAIASD